MPLHHYIPRSSNDRCTPVVVAKMITFMFIGELLHGIRIVDNTSEHLRPPTQIILGWYTMSFGMLKSLSHNLKRNCLSCLQCSIILFQRVIERPEHRVYFNIHAFLVFFFNVFTDGSDERQLPWIVFLSTRRLLHRKIKQVAFPSKMLGVWRRRRFTMRHVSTVWSNYSGQALVGRRA